MTTNTTLVLGGTGKTGRRVARRLTDLGLPVRIGSRSVEPPFDWENQATWKPALRDIDAVYISYYPDIAVPGAADTVQAFVDVAVASGVRRLVLLAGRGEESADLAEEAVRNADVEWTVVRPAFFNQNFSESFLVEPLVDGEVVLPVGNVGEPFVDADDIAEVAVAALTATGHVGRTYELTGPRLLTFADAVAEIAAASGREIRFTPRLGRGLRGHADRARGPGRLRVAADPSLHRGDGRPQRAPGRWRAACAGQSAEGFQRLRAADGRHRRLDRAASPPVRRERRRRIRCSMI